MWGELFQQLKQARVEASEPYLSLYHSGEPEIDVEACAPLSPETTGIQELSLCTLPAVENMASTIHQGSFTGLAGAYAALLKWIDLNGYRVAGPDRAIYLRLPEAGQSRQDPNAITEMQVPVSKE